MTYTNEGFEIDGCSFTWVEAVRIMKNQLAMTAVLAPWIESIERFRRGESFGPPLTEQQMRSVSLLADVHALIVINQCASGAL